MKTSEHRPRWAGLDTLRGVTIVSMIAYHACWDLVYLFGLDWPWYHGAGAYLWQQSICWTFILLSGFCWSLGRHRVRRGLLAFGGGLLVSAVTAVMMPGNSIFCGVLSLLGTATLLTIPLDPLLRRIPARAGLAGSFLLFLLLRDVNSGYLGFEGVRILALPEGLYRSLFTACLGFPPAWFRSTDYFSLFPWMFLFLTGYFLYRLRRGEPAGLRLPVVSAMGRHSLVIYLLHQPLVYGVLLVFTTMFGVMR
ncbi:MAG: heparan-alpha-glucosaminide N-acetyltransferase domain-containing protein [Oscillospiraceae bacterium]|nr:heparan-alpha-glucosaminide N-acetyltransferase domain-containing protein [Oscillospiraceae bacterium]